jgi:flagellar biosynthesis anti-sigma factor FlgM
VTGPAKKSSQLADTVQSTEVDPQDRASLSPGAQQLLGLSKALANVPQVRQARVDALKQAIKSGTYSPSNQQIAQALVSDFTATNPVKQ